jgi:alkanesulfonate monooxygenase SsuD/methylene tetrahydromethanopterin reductase-like flavin-dependent oxidoreductase (luciferase family)
MSCTEQGRGDKNKEIAMKIGIGIPNAIPNTDGKVWTHWARKAEERGFSSLSTIGRIVFDGHEELIALAACAAVTEKIELLTTVMIGPVRESTLLAKQAASLHSLSGGRLTLGLGVGWRQSDFTATGTDDLWSDRGGALEEQIERLREVWADSEIGPNLNPPEIMLGGAADVALRRAGRMADAFIAGPFDKETVIEQFKKVDGAAGEKKPRKLTSRYFALGEDVRDEMLANVRAYYQAGGEDFVKMMQDGVLTTPDQVRQAIEGMKSTGAEELCFWPQLNHLDQIDKLADIVF